MSKADSTAPTSDGHHHIDDARVSHIATDIGGGKCFICFDHLIDVDFERAHLQRLAQNQPKVIAVRLKGFRRDENGKSTTSTAVNGVVSHHEPQLEKQVNRRIAELYNLNGYDVRPPFLTMLPGPPGSNISIPEYRNVRCQMETQES